MSGLPKILIADDNPELRRLLRAQLETMHCELVEATDGGKALEAIILERPDLVVLDVMMPELNGWEICKYIKSKSEYAHIGVVMLTGIGARVNEMTSPLYGADAHLNKPFDVDELTSTIEAVLAKTRGEKA